MEFLLFLVTGIYYILLPSCFRITDNLHILILNCHLAGATDSSRLAIISTPPLASSQIREMALNHFDCKGFYLVSSGALVLQACWPRAFAHRTACAGDKVGNACKRSTHPSFLPAVSGWQECFQIAQFYTS